MTLTPGIEWRLSAVDPNTYHATHPVWPTRALCAKGQACGVNPGQVVCPRPHAGLPPVDFLCMSCLALLDPELVEVLAHSECSECDQRDQT